MKHLAFGKSMAIAVAAAFTLAGPAMAQAPASAPTTHWYDRINVSGSVDMNYDYNFNSPKNNVNQLQVFNNTSNSFQLPLAELNIASAADANNPIGFKISLGYGTAMDFINFAAADKTDYRNVIQAYGTLQYKGYNAEFGKFVSPCGAEVIEAQNDMNYSRSLLFQLIPHTQTGVSVGRALGSTLSGTLYLTNTPDHLVNPDNGKTVGYSINWNPMPKLSVTNSGFFGPYGSETSWQALSDTVAKYTVNDKLSVVGNYDYVHDRDNVTGANIKAQGFAGYVHYTMNQRSAVTLRGEIGGADAQFVSPVYAGFAEVKEGTLTYEYKVAPQMTTRLELREDWGPQIFSYGQNGFKQNQTQIILGNIITF